MATVMAGLQVLEDECRDPLELVTRLESYLIQHVEPGQYLTLFAGILDPSRGVLQYVNAGHCPPTLLAASGSRVLESTGVPVALVPGMPRTASETVLDPGSVLLVFSDGISETECDGRQYEEGQMEEFFEHVRTNCTALDAACVGKLLLEDVEAFRGDAPAADDLTLLVLRREG
jgi:two-component system response regulator